ncbi:MAG: hypothetical protein WCD37_17150 [Chloroflexia bacterium]
MRYLLLFLCLFPAALAQTSAVDIAQLIKDCQANGQNGSLMAEYTYNWKITQRGRNSQGAYKDEFALYETYVPTLKNKGTTKFVLIQTYEKSQPLPPDKVEKERQKAGERLAKAETENQRGTTKETNSIEDEKRKRLPGVYFDANVNFGLTKNVKLSLQTILKQCVFENPRDEALNGRPAIKLDFRPSATAVFEKDQNFLARAQGTIWVDKADRIVVKIEGRQLNTKPNDEDLVFLYQSIRMPEGKWLPERVQFNGSKNKEFFNGMGGDMIFEWLDYKRFVTEAEDAKIKSPK